MKKMFFLALCLVVLSQRGFSQFFVCGNLHDNDSCFGCTDNLLKSNDSVARFFPYGGVFTPKGDIRVLIVFAGFGGIFDTMDVGDWPANSNFPNWAINPNGKAFYNDTSEFHSANIYGDTNRFSVSNYYYQMSKGKFRLMADYYPQKIVVPDSIQFNSWAGINAYVLSQIPATFNWSKYDNRKNSPKYRYDNSLSAPDSVIDYIVFCYRFSNNWTVRPYNMDSSSATAVSRTDIDTVTKNPNYRVEHGFTTYEGATNPIGVFVHETGHNLYGAPHYNGGNDVAGKYFYMPSTGWGMMTPKIFTCSLAWERWLLGWSEITASGVNSDISSPADLALQDTFILRDYITTGDAIRIKIPNGDGEAQHLWIENHQGQSVFDADSYNGEFCYSPISNKKGIGMYVESIISNRSSFLNRTGECNEIKYIHADGNYNFSFDKTPLYPKAGYCNNLTYNLYKNTSNPIGGQNVGEYIRHDFNNDGKILYGGTCNTSSNEKTPVIVMDGDSTADYLFGKGLLFNVGAKIDRSTNPTITNSPKYKKDNKKMDSFYLNGISVEVLRQYANGDICLKIRLDDIDINKNTTYSAAQIVLSDITHDSNPDLKILPNATLTICKSATPNRHATPSNSQISYNSYLDSFVAPTVFTCDTFSYFKQMPNSTVEVKDNSTLILSAFSTYEIGDGAKLIIDSAATIWLRSKSVLRIKGTGRLEIRKGAYICATPSHIGEQYIPGAVIDLQDTLSSLCLRNGYNIGSNVSNEIRGIYNCNSNLRYIISGNGNIRTYSDTVVIQDTVFYGKHYIAGREIKAGHHITNLKPHGNVVIKQGAYVIFDAEKETFIDNGTEVEINGKLEIRK